MAELKRPDWVAQTRVWSKVAKQHAGYGGAIPHYLNKCKKLGLQARLDEALVTDEIKRKPPRWIKGVSQHAAWKRVVARLIGTALDYGRLVRAYKQECAMQGIPMKGGQR